MSVMFRICGSCTDVLKAPKQTRLRAFRVHGRRFCCDITGSRGHGSRFTRGWRDRATRLSSVLRGRNGGGKPPASLLNCNDDALVGEWCALWENWFANPDVSPTPRLCRAFRLLVLSVSGDAGLRVLRVVSDEVNDWRWTPNPKTVETIGQRLDGVATFNLMGGQVLLCRGRIARDNLKPDLRLDKVLTAVEPQIAAAKLEDVAGQVSFEQRQAESVTEPPISLSNCNALNFGRISHQISLHRMVML